MSIDPPSPTISALESEPEYVLGYPLYVALTIAVSRPGASLGSLPLPHTHSLRGAIGLRLWHPSEVDPIVDVEPTAIVAPDLGQPELRLAAGESRRFLVELSPLLPDGLAPGDYSAQLLYGEPTRIASSQRFALRLREPTDSEQQVLTSLHDEVSREGSWGAWAERRESAAGALRPPTGNRDPLRYPRALKYMLYGPVALGAMDDAFLAVLDGVFAADADGFRAEILAAKDRVLFDAYAAQVKAARPGLVAWMDAIAQGATPIAWARTQG
jgi:hypothetical protein